VIQKTRRAEWYGSWFMTCRPYHGNCNAGVARQRRKAWHGEHPRLRCRQSAFSFVLVSTTATRQQWRRSGYHGRRLGCWFSHRRKSRSRYRQRLAIHILWYKSRMPLLFVEMEARAISNSDSTRADRVALSQRQPLPADEGQCHAACLLQQCHHAQARERQPQIFRNWQARALISTTISGGKKTGSSAP